MIKFLRALFLLIAVLLAPVATDRIGEIYLATLVKPKVVALTKPRGRYCTGSHIQYKGKVYMVTNRHCCEGGTDFVKSFQTDYKDGHKVLHISNEHDVCVASSREKYGLFISTDYAIGDLVTVIGYPRGLSQTTRIGNIFDISTRNFPWLPAPVFHKFIHITATSYSGNSGSPVVDRLGRVIGLLFGVIPPYFTEGMVVPSEYIISALEATQKQQLTKPAQ